MYIEERNQTVNAVHSYCDLRGLNLGVLFLPTVGAVKKIEEP
jgi:hypothetical protein